MREIEFGRRSWALDHTYFNGFIVDIRTDDRCLLEVKGSNGPSAHDSHPWACYALRCRGGISGLATIPGGFNRFHSPYPAKPFRMKRHCAGGLKDSKNILRAATCPFLRPYCSEAALAACSLFPTRPGKAPQESGASVKGVDSVHVIDWTASDQPKGY